MVACCEPPEGFAYPRLRTPLNPALGYEHSPAVKSNSVPNNIILVLYNCNCLGLSDDCSHKMSVSAL